MSTDTEQNWWHRSNYAPVAEEIHSEELIVHGKVPEELDGLLLRNGPNSDTSGHWFLGQGMIHGIRLGDGRAHWYKNQRVHPIAERQPDGKPTDIPGASPANTHIVAFAGRLLALEGNHLPVELNADLQTLAPVDFDGQVNGPFCAHPKVCPLTGELFAFGRSGGDKHVTLYRFGADGQLLGTKQVELAAPTMMHDFAITRKSIVLMDLSITYDPALASGSLPFRWDKVRQARLGVLDRPDSTGHNTSTGVASGSSSSFSQDQPRWFDVEPGFAFHTINACEYGDRILLDVCHYRAVWQENADSFESPAMVRRYDIHRTDNFVKEETIFDIRCEYPRIDERRVGLPNRFAYVSTMAEERLSTVGFGHRVVQLDFSRGASVHHHFGPNRYAGEPIFVPRGEDSLEDDGFVLTMVYNKESRSSALVILAGQDLGDEPLATIDLPQRVPYGFHGSWLPVAQLESLS